MEEVDLGGVEASGSGWDDVVDGGDGADLGFSGELALLDLALKVENGLVREDEADLILQVGEEGLEFGLGGTVVLEHFVVLVARIQRLGPQVDDHPEKCVFGDDQFPILLGEQLADLLNLIGPHIAEADENDLVELVEEIETASDDDFLFVPCLN